MVGEVQLGPFEGIGWFGAGIERGWFLIVVHQSGKSSDDRIGGLFEGGSSLFGGSQARIFIHALSVVQNGKGTMVSRGDT